MSIAGTYEKGCDKARAIGIAQAICLPELHGFL
jgi:hypothetical protein